MIPAERVDVIVHRFGGIPAGPRAKIVRGGDQGSCPFVVFCSFCVHVCFSFLHSSEDGVCIAIFVMLQVKGVLVKYSAVQ